MRGDRAQRRFDLDRIWSSRWALRVISLLVGITVWAYVGGGLIRDASATLTVPIAFLNLGENLVFVAKQREVKIELSGSRATIETIRPEQIRCSVNLSNLKSGIYRLPIEVLIPPTVTLQNVEPTTVEVEIKRLLEKSMPVVLSTTGRPKEGFVLDRVEVEPQSVTVRGPEDEVGSIKEVKLVVDLEGMAESSEVEVPVVLESSGQVANTSVLPPRVKAKIALKEGWPRKVVPVRLELTGEVPEDYRLVGLRHSPSRVTLEGSESALKGVEEVRTTSIDLSSIIGSASLDARLILPQGLRAVEGDRVRVEVLAEERRETLLLEGLPLEPRGRSVFKGWRFLPEKVDVALEGRPSALKAVREGGFSVRAFVDVTNLVKRETEAFVQLELPPGVSGKAIPERVKAFVVE